MPVGSIFGACLFGTAFIFSTVIFSQPNCVLEVKRKEIIAPVIFYIFGIVVIISVAILYGKMNLFISIGLFLTYFMYQWILCRYIAYVVTTERAHRKKTMLLESAGDIIESSTDKMSEINAKLE
jgi:Ca2+/Na+ antiporter